MAEFKAILNENGRIVIPAACRRLLDLGPGEELVIRVEDNEMRIFSLKHSLKKAKILVRKHAKNQSLTQLLKTMRHKDREDE